MTDFVTQIFGSVILSEAWLSEREAMRSRRIPTFATAVTIIGILRLRVFRIKREIRSGPDDKQD